MADDDSKFPKPSFIEMIEDLALIELPIEKICPMRKTSHPCLQLAWTPNIESSKKKHQMCVQNLQGHR